MIKILDADEEQNNFLGHNPKVETDDLYFELVLLESILIQYISIASYHYTHECM